MKLTETLDIKPGEVISLVGGGGKTTLMFALARELVSRGNFVITTTTTKILEPSPYQTQLLLIEAEENKLLELLQNYINKHHHITIARERLSSGKLKGVSPELVTKLAELPQMPVIIVEADGAARKSLKAPGPDEPVIPQNTSVVIAVVGIDALGTRLTGETVFRPEIVSRLLEIPLGQIISAESIASLIIHAEGITKGSPVKAKIIPFINKVDLDQDIANGRDLARKILAKRHPQIEQVILGQAQSAEPIIEVVLEKSLTNPKV